MKLLYIEDSEINANAMRRIIERLGHEIWLAAMAHEGLVLLHHQPDLILLDLRLPDADGLDFVRDLRQRGVSVPIIAVTAHAMDGERENCIQAGFDEYLAKPVRFEAMAALLAKHSTV